MKLRLRPVNHNQNVEYVFAIAEKSTNFSMAIIVLSNDLNIRRAIRVIAKRVNKGRSPFVIVGTNQKDWHVKVVGFLCDVYVFADEDIHQDSTNWLAEIYKTPTIFLFESVASEKHKLLFN
jgi:hypothetical protein